MATENVNTWVRYFGNGEATQFSVTFPYIKQEYVKVYLQRVDDDEPTLLDSTRYSFTTDTVITFPVLPSDEVLGIGDILVFNRETELGSDYVFDNQIRLYPEEAMHADDLGFQQIEDLAATINRVPKAPITSGLDGDQYMSQILADIGDAERQAEIAGAYATNARLYAEQAEAAASSITPENFVDLTTTQTITGIKYIPTAEATATTQAANCTFVKDYVDTVLGDVETLLAEI